MNLSDVPSSPARPRRATPLRLASLAALALLAGCESRELREWKPTDHRHPPSVPLTADGRARPTATEQLTPEQREVRTAGTYWNIFCAECHGVNGQGGGPALPPTVQMVSLASPAWQASRTDAQIQTAIANGQGLMPAFSQQLEPDVIALLVRHVRRLGGVAPAAPAQGADGAEPGTPRDDTAPAEEPAAAASGDAPAAPPS